MSDLTSADLVKHGVDHAATYKFSFSEWRNIVHIARLRTILKVVNGVSKPDSRSYIDVGCSNGYITNIIATANNYSEVFGYDYDDENLKAAISKYPYINFEKIDLNRPLYVSKQADLITCFETLEHVGDIEAAIRGLMSLVKPGGTIIISVPIEVGVIGIAKYLAKVWIYKYRDLDELPNKPSKAAYLWALIAGKVSKYRALERRREWGTHFGFDYKDVEEALINNNTCYTSYTCVTTRFFVLKNA